MRYKYSITEVHLNFQMFAIALPNYMFDLNSFFLVSFQQKRM